MNMTYCAWVCDNESKIDENVCAAGTAIFGCVTVDKLKLLGEKTRKKKK